MLIGYILRGERKGRRINEWKGENGNRKAGLDSSKAIQSRDNVLVLCTLKSFIHI